LDYIDEMVANHPKDIYWQYAGGIYLVIYSEDGAT
jgi:hypothetical protein